MTASGTVDERVEAAASVSQRRLTIGICINVVAIAFEVIAVATAMPVAARDLNGLTYYAWSFSLFVIGMLFATVVAGRLSDHLGPTRPLVIGMVIFVAGLLLAGSAQHMLQLVGGRLVQGLGSGLMNTAVFVLVAQVYSTTQRPRIFTFISTAWILPSFVGPPVSAWLTEQLSWHWVFYAVVPLVIGGGLLILPMLRQLSRSWTPAAPDPGAASPAPLWAAGVVALSAAALQLAGQRLDWVALGLLVAGLAGLVVGLPRLMPACFTRLGRGLPAVILSRGLLAGAFVGGRGLRAADARRGATGRPRARRRGSHDRQCRLDDRLVAAVPAVAPDPPRPTDRPGLPVPDHRPGRHGTGRPGAEPAVLPGRRRLGLRRSRHGAVGVQHRSGHDDPVPGRRAGPKRVLAQPVRRPRRRPVRRASPGRSSWRSGPPPTSRSPSAR